MGFKLEVESLGESRQDFYVLRDVLVAADRKFDPTTLSHIPYEQLVLCATGEAQKAACTLKVVLEEKQSRRSRFVSMSPEELKSCENFLKVERMYEDVISDREKQVAPYWDDLNKLQKAWAKVMCISNHVHDFANRVEDADYLVHQAAEAGLLTRAKGDGIIQRLRVLSGMYPTKIGPALFHERLVDVASVLFSQFGEEERRILKGERIRDFQCTSDCFRVI